MRDIYQIGDPQLAAEFTQQLSVVTNGPTEGEQSIKRIKRSAFGFRNFANYRIRALLRRKAPLLTCGLGGWLHLGCHLESGHFDMMQLGLIATCSRLDNG